MGNFKNKGQERTKCPLCGGEIQISYLYQYSHDYRLTKSGHISKKYTKRNCDSMDAAIAGCECGANWEDGEFRIDENGNFIDYKYGED